MFSGFTSGTKALPVFVNRVMSDAYDKADDMPPERVCKLQKADPMEYLNATRPNNFSRWAVGGMLFASQKKKNPPPSPPQKKKKKWGKNHGAYSVHFFCCFFVCFDI